jgi:3-hydroxyacyl-CoA dehydrogenase
MVARPIQKVAVMGAGVMGVGIAAHCANAGLEVLLFDRVSDDRANPSAIAQAGVEKLKKTSPAPLMLPKFAERITPCNTRDDLARLKHVDWVVEAIIEKAEAKTALYAQLASVVGPQTLVSS